MFKRFPFIHNHGDFVHLDALREWFKGVPSLDAFLKYKNDKAIVKDLHFTDEKTTVEYIDTTDDTKKEATLCEYLTSDVYNGDEKAEFNKVKKIRFRKDDLNENYVDVTEKSNGNERKSVIKSYVPAVYPSDSTKKYNEVSAKCSHFGFSPYGVCLYNDKDLTVLQNYQFTRLVAYPAGEKYGESPTTEFISNVGVSDDGIYLYHQDKSLLKKIPFGSSTRLQFKQIDYQVFKSVHEDTSTYTDNPDGDADLILQKTYPAYGLFEYGSNGDNPVSVRSFQCVYMVNKRDSSTGSFRLRAGQTRILSFEADNNLPNCFDNLMFKNVNLIDKPQIICTVNNINGSDTQYPNSIPHGRTSITLYNPTTSDVEIGMIVFTL